MLKALELVGFKSFADKTRFEFPPGITVVVGPNGSGKSNVVDAIKWVLGEQSVKSLRGKEMVDVIFNGSATRRPMNAAETTLVFDNAAGRLAVSAPEVQITRRVYRSGEGEYLLNREPCRLRDIRDLLAGTGAATEAYSVIEQGKVDVLLQSSPRERRLIFEEAAGISRFKAKKLEALRRLERVEQNLLRLSDIVDEVNGRLQTVRQQAAKARQYKELADRMQQLRLHLGWTDWRNLSERLNKAEGEIAAVRAESAATAADAEAIEARALAIETEIAEIDRQLHNAETRLAENRERLATLESTIAHQRTLVRDWEDQGARLRRQMSSLSLRASDVEGQVQATRQAAAEAQSRHAELTSAEAAHRAAAAELTAEIQQLRIAADGRRTELLEQSRAAAAEASQLNSLRTQLDHTQATIQQYRQQRSQLELTRGALAVELAELDEHRQRSAERLASRAAALAEAQAQLIDLRRRQAQAQKDLARWQDRHTAATERWRVLGELERRLEGVSAGVKEVLELSRSAPAGPFGAIHGMLADLLQVDLQTATFIEAALGERAQHLVLGPKQALAEFLARDGRSFAGRVGFLGLSHTEADHEATASVDDTNLADQPGVVGRADEFVQIALEHRPLIRQLLGNTWIVEDLARAFQLAQNPAGRGRQFVTVAGQLLETDGTVVVGPLQSSVGLISRRSELRTLAQQLGEFQAKIAQLETTIAELDDQLTTGERQVVDLTALQARASEQLAEDRLRVESFRQRHADLDAQHAAQIAAEMDAEVRLVELTEQTAVATEALAGRQQVLAETEGLAQDEARRIAEIEQEREACNRHLLTAQVDAARAEQHLESLQNQLGRCEQDRTERQQALGELRTQLEQCLDRGLQADARILAAESELADLYLHKETLAGESVACVNRRESLRGQRATAVEEAVRRRSRLRKLDEKIHKRELAAGELRHQRDSLVVRLREDFGIELPQSFNPGPTATEDDPNAVIVGSGLSEAVAGQPNLIANDRPREEIEAEIADLRGKLANLGHVNLDSLSEADELESRYAALAAQLDDLTRAKASLQQIVARINADSRRLFAETLDIIKGHFQALFRKLFGGGQVDIVLEAEADILDAGVEIIARPPGKEPRSISLLSGGERTLTCLALLLAVFRARPSPFCVLDEVDSALDESNIQRFLGVLEEFLAWTQFVIVTHSKKTMTIAHTLYGVTMQESGVSKRVSVKFEDVSENGEIRSSAANRQSPDEPGQLSRAA